MEPLPIGSMDLGEHNFNTNLASQQFEQQQQQMHKHQQILSSLFKRDIN